MMINKKFLAVGAAVLGFVVLASTVVLGNSSIAEAFTAQKASTSAQEDNPHNFTHFNLLRSDDAKAPIGSFKQVKYNGRVVGEITQLGDYVQVSTNLSLEDSKKILAELKAEGKARALESDSKINPEGENYMKRKFQDGKLVPISDIEAVVLTTDNDSKYVEKPDPKKVLKSLKEVRAKYLESENATVSKPTM